MPRSNQANSQLNANAYYVGFWRRAWAAILDTILLLIVLAPIVTAFYGRGVLEPSQHIGIAAYFIALVIPTVLVLGFWMIRQATPGKVFLQARIVDATTGGIPSSKQWLIRYAAYYVSAIMLGLGFFWVLVDPRKQAWHDKIAGTVVIGISTN